MTGGNNLGRRNRTTALLAGGFVCAMIGLAFASVPLYRLFCQVTGYAGTTQRADSAPAKIQSRVIRVQFDANVAKGLDWRFEPVRREVSVQVGEQAMIRYRAQNRSSNAITGTATFNVTPLKVGAYFSKIDCFCFTEQTLAPGQEVAMPVAFYIDPKIMKDREMDNVKIITLSYTFFRAKKQAAVPSDRRQNSVPRRQANLSPPASGGGAN